MKAILLTALFVIAPALARAQELLAVGEQQTYKTVNGEALPLWIARPSGTPTHTAIVFFHGGGWTGGTVAQFNPQTRQLTQRGMLVVTVQYRLVAKAPSKDSPEVCVEDAKSAMRWVRSHAKELQIDPDKIAAGGGSAGGYLAAATALVPGWDDPQDNLAVSPKPNALALLFPVLEIGPDVGQDRFGSDWRKYSNETYLTKNSPPTIIEGGGDDKLVKPDVLKDYKAKCDAAGARCVLDFYAGQPHGFANKEPYNSITLNAVMHFLESIGYLPKGTPDVAVPTRVEGTKLEGPRPGGTRPESTLQALYPNQQLP